MIDDVLSLVVLAVLKNLEGSVSVWHVFRPIVTSIGATVVGVMFKVLLNKYACHPALSPEGNRRYCALVIGRLVCGASQQSVFLVV